MSGEEGYLFLNLKSRQSYVCVCTHLKSKYIINLQSRKGKEEGHWFLSGAPWPLASGPSNSPVSSPLLWDLPSLPACRHQGCSATASSHRHDFSPHGIAGPRPVPVELVGKEMPQALKPPAAPAAPAWWAVSWVPVHLLYKIPDARPSPDQMWPSFEKQKGIRGTVWVFLCTCIRDCGISVVRVMPHLPISQMALYPSWSEQWCGCKWGLEPS